MPEDLPETSKDHSQQARKSQQGRSLYAIHEVSRLISLVYDDYVAEYGLTRARWWTLMHVGENEGRSQTHIASVLGLGRAAAGRQLAKMEALGLIERRSDPRDSRARRIYLTPEGRALLQPMGEAGSKLFARFFSGFDEGEEAALFDMLERLKANATPSSARS
jgi:DNA-binding MarR family transcriptional regulator